MGPLGGRGYTIIQPLLEYSALATTPRTCNISVLATNQIHVLKIVVHVSMCALAYVCTQMYPCSTYSRNVLHVSACMQACRQTCTYVCMDVCMYVCMSVCMYVCLYVSMYVCMHVCKLWAHVCAYMSALSMSVRHCYCFCSSCFLCCYTPLPLLRCGDLRTHMNASAAG